MVEKQKTGIKKNEKHESEGDTRALSAWTDQLLYNIWLIIANP